MKKKILVLLTALTMVITSGCSSPTGTASTTPSDTVPEASVASEDAASQAAAGTEEAVSSTESGTQGTETAEAGSDTVEKNGEIMILFTSDVHCGVDDNFGYAGLKKFREYYENQGYETILVDDGDALQGDAIGYFSKGADIIDIMNAMEYDVAIPGNHEFDYNVENFLELSKKANYKYICCNFRKNEEVIFDPYTIVEKAGKKIGFVGVTTPTTITGSTPEFFQNDQGEFIYDFMGDENGQMLYDAVQKAVDDVRAEGADYVYLIAHLGNEAVSHPWNYVDVISNTEGIDVVL
nr:metallophosphoesterase [Lachnospiraceae bacterium]